MKYKNLSWIFAAASFICGQAGNYLWFFKQSTAYTVFPIFLLTLFLGIIAFKLGSRIIGTIAILTTLPAGFMSGFIILFFALGGSR